MSFYSFGITPLTYIIDVGWFELHSEGESEKDLSASSPIYTRPFSLSLLDRNSFIVCQSMRLYEYLYIKNNERCIVCNDLNIKGEINQITLDKYDIILHIYQWRALGNLFTQMYE